MKKFKKISLVVLLLSLFMVGVLNTTTGTEITSNLLQKYEENAISYLDISKNKVALMDSYMPNTKVTLYSGLYVSKIKLSPVA